MKKNVNLRASMSRCVVVAALLVGCLTATATATARTRPSVKGFSFSPSSFAAASGGQGVTTIHFRLSKPATVTIAIARERAGRKSGSRCVKSTARLRTRPACKRYVAAGKMTLGKLDPGEHTVSFSGRVGGRTLAAGTYRATITAVDSSHHRSQREQTKFSVRPSKKSPTPTPTQTPAPAPTPAPGPTGPWPNPSNTGVPAGWVPAQTRSSDLVVNQAGAVVQDVLFQNGNLIVNAPNVTVRRVDLQGGRIINTQGSCQNGLVVEDSTFEPPPGQQYSSDTEGATGTGGYTARRVKIWRRQEGFRDGGKGSGCGPVSIEDSFAKISIPPGCPGDPHSDGLQGYDGPPLTVRNTTIDFVEAACGTAAFFVPKNQGNTSATVNGLLVLGGGYPFRMGVPGTVSGLKIVDKSWGYGPIDVACSVISSWDAQIVTITPDDQVASVVRNQPCNSNGGS